MTNSCEKSDHLYNESFFDLAEKILKDKKLSPDEKSKIKNLQQSYNKSNNQIKINCSNNIKEFHNEINNLKELKKVVKTSTEYNTANLEFKDLNFTKKKNIQKSIWTYSDWIFWINTFLAYKNSQLSEVFTLTEISEWLRVNNTDKFLRKFSKLSWVDKEVLAVLDLQKWDFVFYDPISWNISIFNENKNDRKLIVPIKEHLTFVLKNILKQADKKTLDKHLSLLKYYSDKKQYIIHLQDTIQKYWLYNKARNLFSTKKWDTFTLNLIPKVIELHLTAIDLFWDYKNITSNKSEYKSNWIDFLCNNRRLSIVNNTTININKSIKKTPQELSEKLKQPNLSTEFWKWLVKIWPANTWNNSCWRAIKILLKNFWMEIWIDSWHWYYWENILNNRSTQFKKVQVNNIDDVKPWWIIVYWKNAGKWSEARKKYWHVEIKWANNLYYSYYSSKFPGGSTRTSEKDPEKFKKITWFIWYVYYPFSKN